MKKSYLCSLSLIFIAFMTPPTNQCQVRTNTDPIENIFTPNSSVL